LPLVAIWEIFKGVVSGCLQLTLNSSARERERERESEKKAKCKGLVNLDEGYVVHCAFLSVFLWDVGCCFFS
jgi:hypothetical protein